MLLLQLKGYGSGRPIKIGQIQRNTAVAGERGKAGRTNRTADVGKIFEDSGCGISEDGEGWKEQGAEWLLPGGRRFTSGKGPTIQ